MNKYKLIISPHFDDAILSAWSRISSNTCIVTVCGGIPNPSVPASSSDRKCGFDLASDAAIARKKEDLQVCHLLGIKHYHLDFLDFPYDKNKDIISIENKISKIVKNAEDIYAPIGIGMHPDHVIVRDAMISLFKKSNFKLYLYADYPYASEKNNEKEEYNWSHIIYNVKAKLDKTETVFMDTESILKKITIFKIYASQIDVLKKHYTKLIDCPGILNTESFWRVR